MQAVCLFILIIGLYTEWASAQFLNNRPFPTYSLENMPDTDFSCRDKILGGYYADPETQCQMFHVCVKVAGIGIQDFRFLCPNGTAFDQDHQICAEWEDVDCDATTLYYSSDNFDLYRIGSGFESKAVKYGEDEETFALQRAETGDARLNREHQTQRVNQQKELKRRPNQNNDRDIFKTSSSSNFFNNRNNGKEEEDDEDGSDDNVNFNQDRDGVQKRKLIRKQQRRPVENQNYNNNNQQTTRRPVENNYNSNNNNNNRRPQSLNQDNRRPQNRNNHDYQEKNNYATPTSRPQRPTGFTNNFAGSSYNPTTSSTTSRPSTTTISDEQYTTALNNYRYRNGQSTTYKVSTPAPFRQTQQYSRPPPTTTTTQTPQTENYPSNFPFSTTQRPFKSTVTENYPATRNTQQYESTKVKQSENYPTTPFQKKPSSFAKNDNYPSTLPPKPTQFNNNNNYPSTFSPKTNSAYTQITQQTTQYKSNNQPAPFSTPRTTVFTQYTPTVPKITTTTPVPSQQPPRSNRYDETQYDDGSYDATKYERNDDEFLKTAHSQNIANSRNEYIKSTTKQVQQSTQKPQYESPRPFSVTPNTPPTPTPAKNQPSNNANNNKNNNSNNNNNNKNTKKVKDASYDYAYYDTNVGSEPDYDIDTDIKKATVKN